MVPSEVAAAVFAEMRGENNPELWMAVTFLIMNRMAVSGLSCIDIIFQEKAFSFTTESANGPNWKAFVNAYGGKLSGMDASRYLSVAEAVASAWTGAVADFSGGALLFYSPQSMGGELPHWNFSQLRLTLDYGDAARFYACVSGTSCWAPPTVPCDVAALRREWARTRDG